MKIKQLIKKLRISYRNNLSIKLASVRKENKILRNKIAEMVIENRKTIDEITKKNETIRELSLKVREND